MDFIINLIIFLLGLSILIVVHELGHFLCAKAFNVYCHEFAVGMGPVVVSTKKGETQYSIRALPIGGFVSMAGEGVDEAENIKKVDEDSIEENSEEKPVENELPNIPYERTINGIAAWKRFIVISAGVIMNFIFAFIFFFIYILSVGMPDGDVSLISVKDSIAYQAGIQEEIRVNGIEIIHVLPGENLENGGTIVIPMSDANGTQSLNTYLSSASSLLTEAENKVENVNQCVVFRYLENGENKTTNRVCRPFATMVDKENNEVYTSTKDFGIQIRNHYSKVNFGTSVVEAAKMEWEYGTLIFESLGTLFTKEGFKQVSGVVGIFSISTEFASMGFGFYMFFLGFISVNLGVMNLLPIPGLDGSQLIIIGVEGVTRKKLSNKVKAVINAIGLIFLMGLMVVVLFQDILKLIN